MPDEPLPIMAVLGTVLAKVRETQALSLALDEYAERNPESDNVAVRWLSKKHGYEVTLKLGHDALAEHFSPLRRNGR